MKKVTLVTTLTLSLALLATANVQADEATKPQNAPEQPLTTKVEHSTTNTEKPHTEPTKVSKEGTEISVQNPNVKVEQPEGNGRYTPFKVKYEDVKIPDEISPLLVSQK